MPRWCAPVKQVACAATHAKSDPRSRFRDGAAGVARCAPERRRALSTCAGKGPMGGASVSECCAAARTITVRGARQRPSAVGMLRVRRHRRSRPDCGRAVSRAGRQDDRTCRHYTLYTARPKSSSWRIAAVGRGRSCEAARRSGSRSYPLRRVADGHALHGQEPSMTVVCYGGSL